MTLVCYNKPNRSNPRKYTVSDLERISGYVADTGVPLWKMVASVLIGVGAGYLVCKSARAVRSFSTIMGLIKQIALIGASARAITLLLEWLRAGAIVLPPNIKWIAVVIIAVLVVLQKAIQAFENIGDSIIFFEEITENLDEACSFVEKRVGYLAGKGKSKRVFPDLNAL